MIGRPLKFDSVFKICSFSMIINGSHPSISIRNRRWILKTYFLCIVTLLSFFFLTYSIIFKDIKSERYAEVIKNSTFAIVAVTIAFKHSILLHRHKSIKKLINVLEEDFKIAENFIEDEKKIIMKYAKKAVQVCHFWLVAVTFTCFMFPVKAVVMMAYYCLNDACQLVPMFDMTYPNFINDRKDDPVVYCLTFALVYSFDMFAMTVYIGFDPLPPIFMLHTCGQLELLGRRLSQSLKAPTVKEMKENLKRINIKLQEIYDFVKNMQRIFVVLYEFNMKTTTFLIPFSAFQIVESLKNRTISLEFTFFFVGAILHFFLPCYYSNVLMEKSETLRQAIYDCGWELQPDIQIRKTVLLMLTRTLSPLVINTIFYPISLNTFTEMARQAYAIYNILNAAWG